MASEYRGIYVAAGATVTVHTGAGWLTGLVASHGQTTAQTVTVYDGTAAVGSPRLRVHVGPERSPAGMMWTPGQAIRIETGLTVVAGGCDVLVWAVRE